MYSDTITKASYLGKDYRISGELRNYQIIISECRSGADSELYRESGFKSTTAAALRAQEWIRANVLRGGPYPPDENGDERV